MKGAIDIDISSLILFCLLFIIPVLTFKYLRIRKVGDLIISAIRMIVQLSLVGLYLGYIFKLNDFWINLCWIFIMILIANASIMHQIQLSWKKLSFYTIPAYLITVGFVFLCFLIVFDFKVISNSRYIIPLGGMILGNLLRSNVVGLSRFYTSLRRREIEYIQNISLGATLNEAIKPFVKEAYIAAMAPQIATLATIGLVALPGMMTGQILGGSTPITAIKYQIMIMTAIYRTTSISVLLAIQFSKKSAFEEYLRLNRDIFVK